MVVSIFFSIIPILSLYFPILVNPSIKGGGLHSGSGLEVYRQVRHVQDGPKHGLGFRV